MIYLSGNDLFFFKYLSIEMAKLPSPPPSSRIEDVFWDLMILINSLDIHSPKIDDVIGDVIKSPWSPNILALLV